MNHIFLDAISGYVITNAYNHVSKYLLFFT